MATSISYDAEGCIIIVTHRGLDDEASFRKTLREVISLVKESDCHLVLSDYLESGIDVDTIAIYDYPKEASDVAAASGVEIHKIKHAMVMSEKTNTLANFRFYETVSRNRGRPVKIFTDVELAKQWLTGK